MSEGTLPVAGAPDSERVRGMFAALSARYDRANTFMSFGIDRLWRRAAVRAANLKGARRVLDCATGTGSLAFELAKAAEAGTDVRGCDFCEPMLVVARKRAAEEKGLAARVTFEFGDAMALPYRAGSFDRLTMAFGIRNVADTHQGLTELRRVLGPHGKLVILEFGETKGAAHLFQKFLGFWLPAVGGTLTGNREAYSYLDGSSAKFPSGEKFVSMLKTAGFAKARYRTLFPGMVFLYEAEC